MKIRMKYLLLNITSLALERLGELDSAREVFELVIGNYPDNNMASLAQQALDRMSQAQQ